MIQDRVKELREILPNRGKLIAFIFTNYLNFICVLSIVIYILILIFVFIPLIWFNIVGLCSIEALLERTVKHMLFLQSMTNHADKPKTNRGIKGIGDV